MKFVPLDIPDVIVIEPEIFKDERGLFFESYNFLKNSKGFDREINFVQDNCSKSKMGVIRGLHYQEKPYQQGKLIRVTSGEIFDVAVDIRKDSPYFGKHVFVYLSSENKKQIWIPAGFAHGFQVLSEGTEVTYKVDNYYSKDHERTIYPFDIDLKIEWPIKKNMLLSEKDKQGFAFNEIK